MLSIGGPVMNNDISTQLNTRSMRPFQWMVIGICMVLNALDGFDVLVMAFTASAVSAEWSLNGANLGALLSAGLVGMSIGSFFIAPWADRIGRRPLVLICLILAGIGMVMAAYCQTPMQLGVCRGITGLGIGGILASTNVMASEFASTKWRTLAVSLQSTGYALGAVFGGMLAIYLLKVFGWRSVFLAGGVATLAMVPVVYCFLPESIDFLLAKRPANTLQRINRVGRKLGLNQLVDLPPMQSAEVARVNAFAALLSPRYRSATLKLWTLFFFVLFGFYFVMGWTPKLLTTAGLSAEQGITGGVLLSAGGIFGTALLGLLCTKFKLAHVQAVFLIATAALMVVFVQSTSNLSLAFLIGLLLGVTVNGSVAGLFAMAPSLYDTNVRTTGLGLAIGVGRAGGILSPVAAGYFLDLNWAPASLYSLFALAFALAMVVVLTAARKPVTVLSAEHNTPT